MFYLYFAVYVYKDYISYFILIQVKYKDGYICC